MFESSNKITVQIIGTVKNEMKEPGGRSNYNEIISEIVLEKSLADAIDGLDEFHYITVIYWFHIDNNPAPKSNKIHPHRQEKYPLVGVLATRSSDRPNRIGTCVARLIERKDNILKVAGLDAIDGSPVIDIKPYNARLDSRPDEKMPPYASG